MNWLRRITTPKIKEINQSKSKDCMWLKCPSCESLLYKKDLEENMYVCNMCEYHLKMPVEKWANIILDSDRKISTIAGVKIVDDPLSFKDSKKYKDRLSEARHKTKKIDAANGFCGTLNGKPVVMFMMDFDFMAGSMGLSVGKTFLKAIDTAIKKNAAFVAFTASGGARMQEGMLSLMQMPSTIAALCFLKEKKLPFINVFTNPTTGGVLASFATLGDIHIAEPNALIGFAGARVIENTIKQKLPDGFQRSEFLLKHGLIDTIASRKELRDVISGYLNYLLP